MRFEQRPGFPAAARDTTAKILVLRERSLACLVEIALGDLRVCVRFFGKTSFIAINQCAEAWARLIIADDALPFEVTS